MPYLGWTIVKIQDFEEKSQKNHLQGCCALRVSFMPERLELVKRTFPQSEKFFRASPAQGKRTGKRQSVPIGGDCYRLQGCYA